MKLSDLDFSHKQIAYTGFYELETTREIVRLAKAGRVLIDVGANYGYYSLIWSSISANNKSYAFEASPAVFNMLTENVRSNGLQERVSCLQVACGHINGSMHFSEDSINTGWGGLSNSEEHNTIVVPVLTLERFCDQNLDQNSDIQVLKIDTEGADALVIEGARRLLMQKKIRNCFFEFNQVRMKKLAIDKNKPFELFEACGYLVEQITPTEYWAKPK